MLDTPLERGHPDPYDPSLEPRVARLEADMRDLHSIRAAVGRIEATLPHLATQAQVAGIEAKLADKPGKLYLWGVLGVLVAAIVTSYAAGQAALALLH